MLSAAGHEVILLREAIPPDSPDPVVAAVSQIHEAILVSMDSDFRKIAPRVPMGERARFRRLSRIALRCTEPQAARRIQAALSLIEQEWSAAQASSHKRIFIEIGSSWIRTNR